MTYRNPLTPTIISPVNADVYINNLQLAFAGLSWVEYSFGRTTRHTEDIKGVLKTYPKAYQSGITYQNVMPNNNLGKGYSFIEVPRADMDFNKGHQNTWEYDISMVFYFNYKKVDSTKGYPFGEELLQDVMVILQTDVSLKCEVIPNNVTFVVEEIFEGYSLDIIQTQYLMYPWGGFKIDATMKFIGDCP